MRSLSRALSLSLFRARIKEGSDTVDMPDTASGSGVDPSLFEGLRKNSQISEILIPNKKQVRCYFFYN